MRVLIVKTSSLGDIIQTLPVLEYLHALQATVDWIVEAPFAPLLTAHPYLSHCWTVETKRWRRAPLAPKTWEAFRSLRAALRTQLYEVAFDLQGNLKSGLLLSQCRAHVKVGFEKSALPEWPNLLFTHLRFRPPPGYSRREDYLYMVKNFFKKEAWAPPALLKTTEAERAFVESTLEGGEWVGVAPFSAWPSKMVGDAALSALLKRVADRGVRFLFLSGSSQEKEAAERLASRFSGRAVEALSLPALQYLLSRLSFLIAMDSLPLHLCATTSTPTFALFGPSRTESYNPSGMRHGAFQAPCPYDMRFERRCPRLRSCAAPCLKACDVTALLERFERWIETI